jgi:hypothetical protein
MHRAGYWGALGGVAALSLCLHGCSPGGGGGGQAESAAGSGGDQAAAVSPAPGGRIKVEDGAGTTLFQLESSAKGFQVEDDAGKKIGAVKVESDRVKVADAADRPAFKVKQKEGGFKLYREPAAPGGADVELANFWAGDGALQIKDGADRFLYKGKDKGGKFEVDGPAGRRLVVKAKEDGYEVEDPAGKRLIRLKGVVSPGAALFCAATEYDVLQKAAVVAYTARVAP